LAAKKKVAASIQNQALIALLFLYREVLDLPLDLTFQSSFFKLGYLNPW
jgi:hypothetical protein